MKFDYPIPVPKDAMKALGQLDKQPTNPGLLFDRFTPDLHDTHVEDKEKSKWKNDALKAISNHPADKEALDNYKARWELVIAQAHATSFPMRTDWRFIAGLGRKGALEVGFTFHRYGFPVLPGSSVKGIARASAFYEIAGKLNLEGEALSDLDEALSEDNDIKHAELMSAFPSTDEAKALVTEFRKVFGTTGNAGGAVFFDAIPVAPPRLELDIMNPHYPKYYSGEEYPTNWQSPVPVFFLTVAANQEFSFAVGWRGKYDKEAETIRGKAEEYLKAGLTDLGAGAKTSAGYGYFKPAS